MDLSVLSDNSINHLILTTLLDFKQVYFVLISKDFQILHCNNAFQELLQTEGKQILNTPITDFLTVADRENFNRILAAVEQAGSDQKPILLNFIDSRLMPHTILCRVFRNTDTIILAGEENASLNTIMEEELLELNNSLSVLSRENARKGRELTRTLSELKEAQTKLVHQEKMASLGQLTAGMAHEINNPLAYVLGNEEQLQQNFTTLLDFINHVGENLGEIRSFSEAVYDSILKAADSAELEYLSESIPRKIEANVGGLRRVKQIILNLRDFSRLDEADQKKVDIHQGIKASIDFLSHQAVVHQVRIETNFMQLPEILCMPGPLNQAITNILSNAIQASSPGQTVTVATAEEDAWYVITVTDHGGVIPKDIMKKMFDPFFTTKPVGEGVGLGLSIAAQIMKAQNGEIVIESDEGKGTSAILRLRKM